MPRRKYRNAEVTEKHCQIVVRKCWKLYFRWMETGAEIDKTLYLKQRHYAEKALVAGACQMTLP